MTLLAVEDITVNYGRLTALRGVTLKLPRVRSCS